MDKSSQQNRSKRPHLTKEQRLPNCYKEVEKVIRLVMSCKQNYKTIFAKSRLRGHTLKKVYNLTVNVLKKYHHIQKIIDKIQLMEKEKYLRREIATILIYDMLFGSGILPSENKVVTTIKSYENDIRYAYEVLQDGGDFISSVICIPRYVRVHTLVTTVPYVIKDLQSCGFNQVFYDDDLSEEKYLELIKNLKKGSFLIDFHFKDILVFSSSENLTNLDLYKNGHIFLQDKSSFIPVHALDPEPGSAVLDACAAPGMKTVHIASKMKNKGILFACERDKNRFESLKEMLEYGSVKICRTLCKDFKLIDPNDQAYSSVEYILLDPSCSGSGMVNRLDEVTDREDSKNKERLMKLAGFQIILLKHALRFPSVKRVVYSTCSLHEEENEYVVEEALNAFNGSFKLVPVMCEWSNRGSKNFEFGHLCLRTIPEKHLTNGFFVAMFERINFNENYTKSHNNAEQVFNHETGWINSDSVGRKKQRKSTQSNKSKSKKERKYLDKQLMHSKFDESETVFLPKIEAGYSNNFISDDKSKKCKLKIAKDIFESAEKKTEDFADAIPFHKEMEGENIDSENLSEQPHKSCKWKKSKGNSLTETVDSHVDVFMKNKKFKERDHQFENNSNLDYEVVKESAVITSLHKKKKKKKRSSEKVSQSPEMQAVQSEMVCQDTYEKMKQESQNVLSESKLYT